MQANPFPYRWFNAGVSSWYLAWGMHNVMFSWLVIGELGYGAESLGAAQTAALMPALLLMLVGGAAADRSDRRRLLRRLHMCAATVMASLAAAVAAGWLSYGLVIAYALAAGTVMAFVLPTRDALLSDVAGPNMMRAVTGMTVVQWSSWAVGSVAGGIARWLGTWPTLLIQSGIMLAGVGAYDRLPADGRGRPAMARPQGLGEVRAGLAEVLASPTLRPVFLLETAAGLFYLGPFLVIVPMLVRDVYGGDVADLGVVSMAFPAGIIVSSVWLRWRGGVRRKGLALTMAVVTEAACLVALGTELPFRAMFACVCAWGLAAGLSINAARTLFQEGASVERRARVLSVYSLGLLGTAPAGSFLAGWIVATAGIGAATTGAAVAMLAVLALLVARTGLVRLV
ncbi:MAG: MFS transporter [Deltaproteobacteria bacterium]